MLRWPAYCRELSARAVSLKRKRQSRRAPCGVGQPDSDAGFVVNLLTAWPLARSEYIALAIAVGRFYGDDSGVARNPATARRARPKLALRRNDESGAVFSEGRAGGGWLRFPSLEASAGQYSHHMD